MGTNMIGSLVCRIRNGQNDTHDAFSYCALVTSMRNSSITLFTTDPPADSLRSELLGFKNGLRSELDSGGQYMEMEQG